MNSSSVKRIPTLQEIRAERARRGLRKHLPRARKSFAYFLKHFVWVADGGGTKIDPWPWQLDVARHIQRFKRIVTLKARQLGISWLAAAYALWVALFQRGALVLLVSQTEDDAMELLSKVQFIFDHLPEWMRPPEGEWRGVTRCLKFKTMRSAVVALPSTPRAGRGRTARLVIADEHAFHSWATANYNALSPSIDAGGQFWSISTADGIGNFFAEVCELASAQIGWVRPAIREGVWRVARELRKARIGPDAWLPLFLPYEIRPGREGDWWERKKAAHPRPKEFFQEYPREPEEAFIQTGRPRFEAEYLKGHKKLCADRPPLPVEQWPPELRTFSPDELRIFVRPVAGHRHAAGADVAEGLEHGDYSDLTVFDADAEGRPTEVLSLHGHWEPDHFARLIAEVAKLYPGTYGIERNNHGYTTLVTLRNLNVKGLYWEKAILNNQGVEVRPGKPGWETNKVTKPLMVDELAVALRDFSIQLSDALAIPELLFYQVNADGKTSAPSGKHDDRVMSRAIAVQMIKHLPPKPSKPMVGGPGPGSFLSGNMRL